MSIAIIVPNREVSDWAAALHALDPELQVDIWPEIKVPEQVEFVLCWNQPAGVLAQFPALKCISSLGAGVNHLLDDDSCPPGIPLVRLVDDGLKQSMTEYVALGVLEHLRRLPEYRRQQALGEWRVLPAPSAGEVGVGVMGYGAIGRHVAEKLAGLGFRVHCWSRTPKEAGALDVFTGDAGLDIFLGRTDILVCLLPLTAQTENILNAKTFGRLPRGAYLINAARGRHLVEDDLLAALSAGQLSGAFLDVFREEPLPRQHPFWEDDRITITPHAASVTNPRSAALQVVENYHRVLRGQVPLNLVDRRRGY